MSLAKDKYRVETNEDCYCEAHQVEGGSYKDEYVLWLEQQLVNILNLPVVINWVACSDKLPELHKPVLILTDYGKSDVCRLNIDDNRLLWINDMRPQHTNGSVIAWAELPKPPCL